MGKKFDVILFDLGGVIIELTGVPTMQEWVGGGISPAGIWEKWLTSNTVRKFETGNSSADEFAKNMVEEFKLPVSAETFLDQFVSWPKGLYPGAKEFIVELGKDYTTASFSNTNPLHWDRFVNEMGIEDLFDENFPSHLIGVLKPDPEAYINILKELDVPASRILFVDDNLLNIEPAKTLGITSVHVSGFTEAQLTLQKFLY